VTTEGCHPEGTGSPKDPIVGARTTGSFTPLRSVQDDPRSFFHSYTLTKCDIITIQKLIKVESLSN